MEVFSHIHHTAPHYKLFQAVPGRYENTLVGKKRIQKPLKKMHNLKQMWVFITARYLNCQLYPHGK